MTLYARTDEFTPLNVDECTEAEAQSVVRSLLDFFNGFLDIRPYQEIGQLSVRAENVLKCNHAHTIGDVKRLLMQALSNQGVPRAGKLVQAEWAGLIRQSVMG